MSHGVGLDLSLFSLTKEYSPQLVGRERGLMCNIHCQLQGTGEIPLHLCKRNRKKTATPKAGAEILSGPRPTAEGEAGTLIQEE